MALGKPPGVRYATRYCALLKRDVEVALTHSTPPCAMWAGCAIIHWREAANHG